VVEICRVWVPVMMEKALAVSLEDARAIEKAARAGKIQVLVNYETTWYRSQSSGLRPGARKCDRRDSKNCRA